MLVALSLALAALPRTPAATAATPSTNDRTSEAGRRQSTTTCTNPPPTSDALTPAQLQQRYGLTPLHAAGFDGRGQTAVILAVAESVDIDALAQFGACLGVAIPPVTQVPVPGSTVPPPSPTFTEAQGDIEALATGAPGLDQVYVVVMDDLFADLATALQGLADGSLTGGRRPDVATFSFGGNPTATSPISCVPNWSAAGIAQVESALQGLAAAGTWFFRSGGDAGSSDCAGHPTCNPNDGELALGYPTASPWVTAVGGTQLDAGVAGPPVVWDEHQPPGTCMAGGGGPADPTLFPRPPYQASLPGGLTLTSRGAPDVAALAGSPWYLDLEAGGGWVGTGGTSLASPFTAGLAASVRSALVASGITPPTPLNPALYALAADPATYAAVFTDVTSGTNDLYQVGCCTAGPGYDLASGLGELNAAALAAALARATPPTPPTTAASTSTTTSSPGPLPLVTPAFTG